MDAGETALAGFGAGVTAFASTVLGEPLKVASAMLADQIYYFRWENRMRFFARAQKRLAELKLDARTLPPEFAIPLLDAVGDVQNETLQDLWTGLLASAVESDKSQHPAFIRILKDLNADEARILRKIALGSSLRVYFRQQSGAGESISQRTNWHLCDADFAEEMGTRPKQSSFYVEHLDQLGLIELDSGFRFARTPWGTLFLQACMPGTTLRSPPL